MAKILSILECTGKEGEKYWDVALEGKDKKAYARKPGLKVGDDIPEERISLSKNGNSYNIRTEGQTYQGNKASYQKNDDLIIAQVAYKGLIDLVIAGKEAAITENLIIRHGTWIKKSADLIRIMTDPAYAPAADQAPAPADKTAVEASPTEFNLQDVLACDWETFERKDYDVALAGMAKYKKLAAASAKAFLVDKFGIESSALIPRGKRNEVIKAMAELA